MALVDEKGLLPLTPVVLHILLTLADGERHGYAIAQEVEETTDGQIRMGPGTLYGSIQRMLNASLIEETPQRRRPADDDERRRYYRMTALGKRALESEVNGSRRSCDSPARSTSARSRGRLMSHRSLLERSYRLGMLIYPPSFRARFGET
jgi:DNA-binding PadR family transcriptional regulator